jgi:excisionase family DNA binding protein
MDKLFTPEQAADYLQVSSRSVYRWIHTGRLPARKVGRLWRITEADLAAFPTAARGPKDEPR